MRRAGQRRPSWPPLLVLAAFQLTLGACSAWADSPALPPIRSGSEYDYPPFCTVDADGRADGFSVELLRAALAAMGRDVTFRTGPWPEVRGWLERGQIDALPLVGRTPEREALFDFTFPYISLHGAIVVREGTDDIRDLADLKGRPVAVLKGDNAEEFLRREDRGILIHTTATFEDALRELASGACDAVVMQRLVALRLIRLEGITGLQVLNQPLQGFQQDFCFAVREGDRVTLALLNEGLSVVMADGTFRRLYTRWYAVWEIPSDHRLLIGGDQSYPPYEFLDQDGRPAGYNVDLTRAIAREMGLDVDIRLGPWDRVRQGLESGDLDAIQGMLYSPERDLLLDFSQPHADVPYVSVVRRGDAPPPTSLDDLAGKRIVVQRGDIMHDLALENGLADQVAVVATQEEALGQLASGQHDCALVARPTATYWIDRHQWANLVLARQPLQTSEYSFAVAPGHGALLALLNDGLDLLERSGEHRRIQRKWLGADAQAEPDFATILEYVALVAGPLLLLLLASVLWSRSLRRQVARRTAELRDSEELLNATGEMARVGGWEVDARTRQVRWTAVTRQIHEVPPEYQPTIDKAVHFFHPDDRPRLQEAIRRALEEAEPYDLEVRFITARGNELWTHTVCRPVVEDGSVVKLAGTFRDITARKRAEQERQRLEEQLLQAHRLEAVGRLAGGVAHDFNNMLHVILGYCDLAIKRTRPGDPLAEPLAKIHQAARHSADLTRQLLGFARQQTIAPRVLDLNDAVATVLHMLRRLIGEDIDLVWQPGANLWPVHVDPSQVEQLLTNLCVNARDAIDDTGKVTVETGNAVFDQAYCTSHPGYLPGEYALLAVSDDGCGMDAATRDRIFEPFFTTKGVGQGTGLGLATVFGIVKQNDGFINVYSEPGQGSTFRLYLPRAVAEDVETPPVAVEPGLPAGTDTVLFVEDEPAILDMGRTFLEELGYTVLAAGTPDQALGLAARHPGPIHLLLTDVVMPGMNGRDLAAQLAQGRPDLRVAFMSGYTANVIAHHGVLEEGVHFLPKPFSQAEMATLVRQALDTPV